jgi:hypothetical protein
MLVTRVAPNSTSQAISTSGSATVRSRQQSEGWYVRGAHDAEVAVIEGSDGGRAVALGDRDNDCVSGAQR